MSSFKLPLVLTIKNLTETIKNMIRLNATNDEAPDSPTTSLMNT